MKNSPSLVWWCYLTGGVIFASSLALGAPKLPIAKPAVPNASSLPPLLPWPRQVVWGNGGLALRRVALETPANEPVLRAETTRILNGVGVVLDSKAPLKIRFATGAVAGVPAGSSAAKSEAYSLRVAKDIEITAPTAQGRWYGLQTLRQMLERKNGVAFVPAAQINDWPAFSWRGFMHDVGRNPQDFELLKRFVDVLARYKFNVFHLHLTDDSGWRVECRVHPELNQPQLQDATRRPGFFYTYAQLRELAAYCQQRGIELVPELDMPGHSAYFKRAFGVTMQDEQGMKILQQCIDEFLKEVPTRRLHIGGDEVHITNPAFMDTMTDFVRARGAKVIVWRPGTLPKGDYIVQRWSAGAQNNTPPEGIAQIDSRHNYINHMDALEAPLRMLMLQPCDKEQGDDLALGGTLCHWPDNNVGDQMNVYRQSPVLPALLGAAERYWRGGPAIEWKHIAMMPLPTDSFYPTYQNFGSRLVAQRDQLKGWPFPYVRNSDIPWKVIGPFPNGGAASKVFDVETEMLDEGDLLHEGYEVEGKDFLWVEARGGTIQINHFFDYPGWLPPTPTGTAYAYTNIWSPRAQTVGFWIGFNGFSRSGGRRGGPSPALGEWSNTGSKIWVNGRSIAPPQWKQPKLGANTPEIPFEDEDYFYRQPTQVPLQAGWNRIFIKAPRVAPAWKWCFTCVPVQIVDGMPHEVEGLKFSLTETLENDGPRAHNLALSGR